MTAYYGTNSTKRSNTVPPAIVDNGEFGGRVRVSYDEITTTTAMTTSDTIEVGVLPVGARVLGIHVTWVAHATGRTFTLGISGTAALFHASQSSASAGRSDALAAAGSGYKNTTGAPLAVILTLAGGTLAASAKGFTVTIFYVQD